MTAPAHAEEHDQLMMLIGKLVNKSSLIDGAILITIGVDGRPCIGGNLVSPQETLAILRELAAPENEIQGVTEVALPEDN